MYDLEKQNKQNLSIYKIIFLGLFPGIITLLAGIIFTNPLFGIELPFLLVGIIAMTCLGSIPTELAIIKYFSWKEKKKIKEIILFKNKTTIKKFVISILITFLFAGIAYVIVEPYEAKMWDYLKVFNFIPDWFRMDAINLHDYNDMKIIVLFYYLLNGIIAPIVEEIYFRGYLLPRMDFLGKAAPLINVILFSIYHFFHHGKLLQE
jgi:membrane protease YdiL (CAAX protease family)